MYNKTKGTLVLEPRPLRIHYLFKIVVIELLISLHLNRFIIAKHFGLGPSELSPSGLGPFGRHTQQCLANPRQHKLLVQA